MISFETGYLSTRKRKVIKKESDQLHTWIYYADGRGVLIENRCGNVHHFDHSYIDPDIPTGGH